MNPSIKMAFFARIVRIGLMGSMTVLIGCSPKHQAGLESSMPTPVVMNTLPMAAAPASEGSLWQTDGPLGDLFNNDKAKRVGDIVTVKIIESSKASNNAKTKTDRTSTIDAGIDTLLGLEGRFNNSGHNQYKKSRLFNPFGKIKGGLESEFEGEGETSRSGDLKAYITAQVVGVLPSGNLQISGSREVTVNNERQIIHLTGVIRPRDITPNNVVLSTHIADARIAYTGKGVVDERQRPGWLARLLDIAWPF